jgi:short-subunit dehydrogenase
VERQNRPVTGASSGIGYAWAKLAMATVTPQSALAEQHRKKAAPSSGATC